MAARVTEADARDFRECGIAVIRNALTPAQVEALRRTIDAAYKGTNIDPCCNLPEKERKEFENFPCFREHPEFNDVVFRSDLPKIAAQLTGSRTIRLHHEQVHVEVPNTAERTPWHADDLFYNVDGNQSLSLFVTVDPMPLGNAEFVLGSHKWPSSMPRYLREMFAKGLPLSVVPETPNVEASRSVLPVVSWALQPGDCLAFSFHTLHLLRAATGLRRGMSIRYLGDDATYAPRPWVTFPCFLALEKDLEGMKVGGPMHHSSFPVAYTRDTKL